jgi:ribonucleotide monophosphatase NagD (HAD superfamily)
MTVSADTIPLLGSIGELDKSYAAWLVDIWGVMHNGVRAFPAAVEATRRFREQGGIVVLLSNSPRPSDDCSVNCAASVLAIKALTPRSPQAT